MQNATMVDFAGLMQTAVLDQPVVDQTSLPGKWNFLLKWTPDESQFGGMGVKVPPPSDAADAPPPLFTAIQEQIGTEAGSGQGASFSPRDRQGREAFGQLVSSSEE